MSLFKRAFLYTIRKKTKTLILFSIILVMCTFILSGFSIQKSTAKASENLRERLGGNFHLKADMSNPDNWTSKKSEYGFNNIYNGPLVDDALIDKVMEEDNIQMYNAYEYYYLYTKTLQLTPGLYSNTANEANSDDIWAKIPKFIGNTNSEFHEFFQNKSFELVKGNHITNTDKNKALISEELAVANNLDIGDTFSGEIHKEIEDGLAPNAAGQTETLEIAGIFKINSKQSTSNLSVESDLPENFIFTDMDTCNWVTEAFGDPVDRYANGATFYVKDPKEIDRTIERLSARKDIDWKAFQLDVDDSDYKNSAGPLEQMGTYVTILIIIIIAVCIVLLSLILTMWMKGRIHEMGVLLSIGINKSHIILQFIVECMTTAIAAFIISYFAASAISGQIGNQVLQITSQGEVQEEETGQNKGIISFDDEPSVAVPVSTPDSLDIDVSFIHFLFVIFIGTLIVTGSVFVSSVSVIRMKPREILSAMS